MAMLKYQCFFFFSYMYFIFSLFAKSDMCIYLNKYYSYVYLWHILSLSMLAVESPMYGRRNPALRMRHAHLRVG